MSTRRPGSRVQTPTPAEPDGSAATQDTTATPQVVTDGQQRNSVVFGPNDRLVGQLYIEGDLRVSGNLEGQVEATGDIEISGAGKVSGTVTAYNRLVVGGGATLIGADVRVGRLTVEDGATFSGHVTMGKAAIEARKAAVEAAPPAPQPTVEELPAETQTEAIEVVTPVTTVESEPAVKQRGRRR